MPIKRNPVLGWNLLYNNRSLRDEQTYRRTVTLDKASRENKTSAANKTGYRGVAASCIYIKSS